MVSPVSGRLKLAEMARQIEAVHDQLERVAYQFKQGTPDWQVRPAACESFDFQTFGTPWFESTLDVPDDN